MKTALKSEEQASCLFLLRLETLLPISRSTGILPVLDGLEARPTVLHERVERARGYPQPQAPSYKPLGDNLK